MTSWIATRSRLALEETQKETQKETRCQRRLGVRGGVTADTGFSRRVLPRALDTVRHRGEEALCSTCSAVSNERQVRVRSMPAARLTRGPVAPRSSRRLHHAGEPWKPTEYRRHFHRHVGRLPDARAWKPTEYRRHFHPFGCRPNGVAATGTGFSRGPRPWLLTDVPSGLGLPSI
jgi:hypothetical protein